MTKILLKYNKESKRVTLTDSIKDLRGLENFARNELGIDSKSEMLLKIYDDEFKDYCNIENFNEITNGSRILVEVKGDAGPSQASSSTSYDSPLASTSGTSNMTLKDKTWSPGTLKFNFNSLKIQSKISIANADDEFTESGKLYETPTNIKKDILSVMSESLLQYSYYPSMRQYEEICESLVTQYPCLREPIGNGYSGWRVSLKYRVEDFRRNNKSCSEIKIRSRAQAEKPRKKSVVDVHPEKLVTLKKVTRGEINFSPEYGSHQKKKFEDAKQEMVQICESDPNMAPQQSEGMDITYAYRREEILKQKPALVQIKKSWPALFHHKQLYEEMARLTGVYVEGKMEAWLKKHGTIVAKEFQIEEDNGKILLHLSKYFKEQWTFCQAIPEDERPSAYIADVNNVYTIRGEKAPLIENIDNLVEAATLLIALYYVCNLAYPPKGKITLTCMQLMMGVAGENIPQRATNFFNKTLRLDFSS